MLDWNGNGRIDPVDVGISLAAQDIFEEEDTFEENAGEPSQEQGERTGFWTWVRRKLKKRAP